MHLAGSKWTILIIGHFRVFARTKTYESTNDIYEIVVMDSDSKCQTWETRIEF